MWERCGRAYPAVVERCAEDAEDYAHFMIDLAYSAALEAMLVRQDADAAKAAGA